MSEKIFPLLMMYDMPPYYVGFDVMIGKPWQPPLKNQRKIRKRLRQVPQMRNSKKYR